MGMTEQFEMSLQVLRGFDTDISVEVNDIKVLEFNGQDSSLITYLIVLLLIVVSSQRAVASTSKRTTIRFADLKLKRYWFPLVVGFHLYGL